MSCRKWLNIWEIKEICSDWICFQQLVLEKMYPEWMYTVSNKTETYTEEKSGKILYDGQALMCLLYISAGPESLLNLCFNKNFKKF